MSSEYSTPEEHIELLIERGYFVGKTQSQVDYWVREFNEQIEQQNKIAILEQGPVRFMMPLYAKFNDQLETVNFTLRYKCDLVSDVLSLASLHANLRGVTKTWYCPKSEDLIPAAEAFERLRPAAAKENNIGLFINLWKEQERQKNPENDYDPDAKNNPRDIKDEPKDQPRIGTLSPEFKARLPKLKW